MNCPFCKRSIICNQYQNYGRNVYDFYCGNSKHSYSYRIDEYGSFTERFSSIDYISEYKSIGDSTKLLKFNKIKYVFIGEIPGRIPLEDFDKWKEIIENFIIML